MASSLCFNHDERNAEFKCFDCKQDCVVKYCAECNTQIHSLEVFRLHKSIKIEKVDERRLSQDVSDVEKLVAVESTILQDVVLALKYHEKQEMDTLHEYVSKAHERLHQIQECHRKVDKALLYLAKVTAVVNHLSSEPTTSPLELMTVPVTSPEGTGGAATEAAGLDITLDKRIAVMKASYNGPTPGDEFPVCVVGSLTKNGCFWMVKKGGSEQAKVNNLESTLRDYYQVNAATPAVLTEGAVYAARVQNRLQTWNYWRVRVEKLSQGTLQVKIRYLDHGMMQEIPIDCLVGLPRDFKDIPFQAFESCLYPYSDDVSLPYEAKWCFKDLTHNRDLMARINAQVIPMHGRLTHYVQLTSVGPSPLNINLKIMKLVEEKKTADEDRPILPRNDSIKVPVTAEVAKADSSTNGDSTAAQNIEAKNEIQVAIASESHPRAPGQEQEMGQGKIHVEPQSSSQDEKPPSVSNVAKKSTPSLLEAPVNRITILKPERQKVENVLKPQRVENTIQGTTDESAPKPAQFVVNTSPQEFVPIGMVNETIVSRIQEKCAANRPPNRGMFSVARYIIIHGEFKRFIEAMKRDTWCMLNDSSSHHSANLNRLFSERRPVLLVFMNLNFIDGLAQMMSPVNVSLSHCSICPHDLSMYWGQQCRAEFALKWLFIAGIPTNVFQEPLRKALHLCKSYMLLPRERGTEVAQKLEKGSRGSILGSALKHFRQNIERPFRSSCEDLAAWESATKKQTPKLELLENGSQEAEPCMEQRLDEGSKEVDNPVEDLGDAKENAMEDAVEVPSPKEPDVEPLTKGCTDGIPSVNSQVQDEETPAEIHEKGPKEEPSGTPKDIINGHPVETPVALQDDGLCVKTSEDSKKDLSDEDLSKAAQKILGEIAVKAQSQILLADGKKERPKKTRSRDKQRGRGGAASPEDWESDLSISPRKVAAIYTSTGQVRAGEQLPEDSTENDDPTTGSSAGSSTADAEEATLTCSLPDNAEAQSADVLDGRGSPEGIEADEDVENKAEVFVSDVASSKESDEAMVSSTTGSNLAPNGSELPDTSEDNLTDVRPECSSQEAPCESPVPFSQSAAVDSLSEAAAAVPEATPSSEREQPSSTFYQPQAPPDSSPEDVDIKVPFPGGDDRFIDVLMHEHYLADYEPVNHELLGAADGAAGAAMQFELPAGDDDVIDELVEDILPVKRGHSYRVMPKKELTDKGKFWVRMIRDDEVNREFNQFSRSMNRFMEERGKPLKTPHLYKCCCLYQPTRSKASSNFQRALITDTLPNNMFKVRMLDTVKNVQARLDDLLELPIAFQIDFPQQAFQCHWANRTITEEDKRKFKELPSGPVNIKVIKIKGETAIVDIENFDNL